VAEFVSFSDPSAVYKRPMAALAGLDAMARDSVADLDAGTRVYSELPICRTQAERDGWITYEAIMNRAFARRPVALMRQAWQAHRVVHDNVWQISPVYEEPEALVRALEPVFEALPGLRALSIGDPQQMQERLAEELAADSVASGRARDMLVAAREVLLNAQRFGNRVRALRVGIVADQWVCEVTDGGSGLGDPLAGYVPPKPAATEGAGLWIARQLTSRLELRSEPTGLTVRLRVYTS
jgi:anti-sigma regulatory factor (Ser/Thr protein kinase)